MFLKGQKVAGTSFEMALSEICGPDDIITPITPIDEKHRLEKGGHCQNYHEDQSVVDEYLESVKITDNDKLDTLNVPKGVFGNHMPREQMVQAYESHYNEAFPDYEYVAITRNPYAKIISYVNWLISFSGYKKGQGINDNRENVSKGFDQLVRGKRLFFVKNLLRYQDASGSVHDVTLLKYENLSDDLAAFAKRKDMDLPELPFAKKGLMSNKLDPLDLFEPRQIEIINTLYEDEFKAFGYDKITV